jgi:uncharacterized membrane protein
MKFPLILLILLFLPAVNAANLYGDIYTWDLEKISGVKVIVDSTPRQSLISTDGSYGFELNPGVYNLYAEYNIEGIVIASSLEEIEITEDGNFRIDIILFPEMNYEDIEDINLDTLDIKTKGYDYLVGLAIILILTAFAIWFKRQKPKKKQTSLDIDESDKVLKLIKQQGGRITQKNIRKTLIMSEAKISLIIAELIHKNKIEKIKKGRGNIIILKK